MDLRAESALAKQTISIDTFLSPLPISDWLTFCCGNLILHRKKKKRKWKKQILWWKSTENAKKSTFKHEVAFFTLNSLYWPMMEHAPNIRETEKT